MLLGVGVCSFDEKALARDMVFLGLLVDAKRRTGKPGTFPESMVAVTLAGQLAPLVQILDRLLDRLGLLEVVEEPGIDHDPEGRIEILAGNGANDLAVITPGNLFVDLVLGDHTTKQLLGGRLVIRSDDHLEFLQSHLAAQRFGDLDNDPVGDVVVVVALDPPFVSLMLHGVPVQVSWRWRTVVDDLDRFALLLGVLCSLFEGFADIGCPDLCPCTLLRRSGRHDTPFLAHLGGIKKQLE